MPTRPRWATRRLRFAWSSRCCPARVFVCGCLFIVCVCERERERKREREREREREFIILSSRGVFFCRFRNKGTQRTVFKSNSHRVFKNHTSLRFKYSSSSSGIWSSKNCLISQILLPFNSSKPLQSLLRLNRQVSRGARRSSSSASSFAERERTLLENLLKKRDSH